MINEADLLYIIHCLDQLEQQKTDVLFLEQIRKRILPIQKEIENNNNIQKSTITSRINKLSLKEIIGIINRYPQKITESQNMLTKMIVGIIENDKHNRT